MALLVSSERKALSTIIRGDSRCTDGITNLGGDHHANLESLSPCQQNIHLQAFKTQKGKKKKKKKIYSTRDWRQELTLGARTQSVGRVNVCSGNDARRQEAMSGVRWAVTLVKKGKKLLSPPSFTFLPFSQTSQHVSPKFQ